MNSRLLSLLVLLFLLPPSCALCEPHLAETLTEDVTWTPCQVAFYGSGLRGVWVSAHYVVYDVTQFVSMHPAGPRPILNKAGCDVTRDFDFHSAYAKNKVWRKFQRGKLVTCQHKFGDASPTFCSIM